MQPRNKLSNCLSGSQNPNAVNPSINDHPSTPHTHTHTRISMMSSTTLPFANGGVLSSAPRLSSAASHFSAAFNSRWGMQREQNVGSFPQRITGQATRVLANPNASPGKMKKEVFMVDPLEAKRLAAKQMELIKAKENFKRRRQIEAINGAWAMIGLTAGLVIEGHTGKSILAQLTGYWDAIVGLVAR